MAAVLGVAGVTSADPAAAAETYARPASGSFVLDGRGFGHGIGMSQYGAKGAAEAGLTWPRIMAYYYPGTQVGDNGNPTIRVRLSGLTTLPVVAQPGLSASLDRTSPTPTWQTLPATVTRGGTTTYTVDQWDVAYVASSDPAVAGWWLRFSPTTSAGFLNYARSPSAATTVAIRSSAGTVRWGSPTAYRTHRGELRHVRSSNTSTATRTIVDALPMESYLRGVVPNEMPASWSTEAVRSQAVAARSYAEWERSHASSSASFDTCDTTQCQVMKPVETESSLADAAVSATAGKIVTYGGSVAFTQFSASNGGYSVQGSMPYLTAHSDPYDAYTWTSTVAVTTVESKWPSIGRFTAMSLTRDGLGAYGGRVTRVDLQGSTGSVSMTGSAFASALGLRHCLFKPRAALVSPPTFPVDVTGDGAADVVAVVRSTGELRVYPGTGTGGFGRPISAAAGGWSGFPLMSTAGPWDQGSVADLMTVGSDGGLRWYRGRGDGRFDAAVQIGQGFGVYDLLTPIGDFNGDGGTDLLGRRTDGTLWLVEGNGQGQVFGQLQVGSGWAPFTAIFSPGDFTGDRLPDVVGRDAAGYLWLYAGAGGGRFRSRVQIGKGWTPFTTIWSPGDFSGDGRADVLAGTSDGGLWLYRGTGTGGFGTKSLIGKGWQAVRVLP